MSKREASADSFPSRPGGWPLGRCITKACLISFLLLPPLPAAAKGKRCVDCHRDIKAKIKSGRSHRPARSCGTCHKRHGFAQKLVLVKKMPDLCFDCHRNVKKEAGSGRVHPALTEGGCTVCHDPHASKADFLMKEGKGNVCFTCHRELQERLRAQPHHEPVERGQCSACHEPHSSERENLLVAAQSELCRRCHGKLEEKHSFPSFVGRDCSDCHDPHTSSPAQPLSPLVHAPFSAGECSSCHKVEEGQVVPGDMSPDLCARCHRSEAEAVTSEGGHIGAADLETCGQCHEPHRSAEPHLLKEDPGRLCRRCHEDLPDRNTYRGSFHLPFLQGQCTRCHDPHRGKSSAHLVAEGDSLCSSCHNDKFPPAGQKGARHAALGVKECRGCHRAHASPTFALLVGTEEKTCLECHEKEDHTTAHPPYLTGACLSCHTNHSDRAGLLAAADIKTTCAKCHPKTVRRTAATVAHPPAKEEDCTLCHQPHGSDAPKLLAEKESELCTSCHEMRLQGEGGKDWPRSGSLHAPIASALCSDCHDPHGADNQYLLRRKGADLCYGCHTAERLSFAEGKVHMPVKEGNCKTCHDPHVSLAPSLLKKGEPDLCLSCHRGSKEVMAKAHAGIAVESARCSDCHAPHSSLDEHLLRANLHQPFAEGECGTCHREGKAELVASVNELCVSCHDDKTGNKGHKIEGGTSCTSCHLPHAAETETMLKNEARSCLRCHSRLTTEETGSVKLHIHRPLRDAGCGECHRIHEPRGEKLLTAAPSELCRRCHQDLAARQDDPSQHPPFAKGRCGSCHEVHASSADHLLRKEPERLCRTCHSLKSKKMAAAHREIPLRGSGCPTCHDPHSSPDPTGNLLFGKEHAPVEAGECQVCHSRMEREGYSNVLCLDCHDEGEGSFADVHPGGVKKGSCLDCHSPHAGYESLFAKRDPTSVCFRCHNRAAFARKNKHEALGLGCTSCHDLHDMGSADTRGDGVMELCGQCHEESMKHTHPVGKGYIDPRSGETLTCTSCHLPHSSDNDFLLSFDYRRDLCVQCHAGRSLRAH